MAENGGWEKVLSSSSNRSCFFNQLCSVFGLKPETLTAVSLHGGTLGRYALQQSQRGTCTCLKARENRDVDTEKRVSETGSTSALMRAGGTAVFPAGTQPRTMKIRLMPEWDYLDI